MMPMRTMMRLPSTTVRATAPILALLLAGCVGSPPANDRGVRISAQRLLALDFGSKVTGARIDRLTTLPAAFGDELQRPTIWSDGNRPLRDELRRATNLPGQLRAGARFELLRAPRRLDLLLPDLHDFEQDVADDLDQGLRLFGTGLHPLGEISDREHRVDHRDERPELTLLQRLRRRLRL
jgi:hypothetical protein